MKTSYSKHGAVIHKHGRGRGKLIIKPGRRCQGRLPVPPAGGESMVSTSYLNEEGTGIVGGTYQQGNTAMSTAPSSRLLHSIWHWAISVL